MSDGFGLIAAEPRPRRPSAPGFVIAALLLVGILVAVGGWMSVELDRLRSARTGLIAVSKNHLMLGDALSAMAFAQTAERELRRRQDQASLARYRVKRGLVDRSLARLAVTANPALRPEIDRLGALVRARFATSDDAVRAADPARARMSAQPEALREIALSRAIEDGGDRIARAQARSVGRDIVRSASAFDAVNLVFRGIAPASIVIATFGLWLWWRASRAHYRLERRAFDMVARLRAVFASASDAIIILYPDGRIEEVNAATWRLLGYPPTELEGRSLATIIALEPRDLLATQPGGRSPTASRPPVRVERVARDRSGQEVPVDIAFGTMPLPDGIRIVASLRDASERRIAERMKDDFISTISHELRTPLTSVVGALGLLREGAAGALPDAAARLIAIAENNSRRLIRLVNDILDIDRLGSGRLMLDLARTDLRDVAIRARDDAEGLAAPRSVHLALDVPDRPVIVTGDAERLLQVIGNLLSNAVRFSPHGDVVSLAVERRGGDALIRVEDQGPGVPAEFREQLFGRFIQSSAGAAIPGGTGLGLAISREIVRAHHGDIWYADRHGGGARFCVSLPCEVEAGTVPRRRLLLCEDDADAAARMRDTLEDRHYLVDRCGTAAEACAMTRTGRYDVLLLDLALPDADGLDAVRAIRDQPATRSLPVIVVSASADDWRDDAAAERLAVVDWIDKPVDQGRLAAALDAAIARADGQRPVLLHVDDDPDVREVVALAIAGRGRILQAGTLASARALLATCTPAVVILDLDLPDGSGLDLLPALAGDDQPRIPAIVYSAQTELPAVGGGIDAVLVKSLRSNLMLSDTIGVILAQPIRALETEEP